MCTTHALPNVEMADLGVFWDIHVGGLDCFEGFSFFSLLGVRTFCGDDNLATALVVDVIFFEAFSFSLSRKSLLSSLLCGYRQVRQPATSLKINVLKIITTGRSI